MKNADIITSLTEMVEEAYKLPCHCEPGTSVVHKHFVVACLALANIGFQERERYEQMAAMGLSSWTEPEREAFYNEYEVRWSIMKMVDNPPAEWPQPKPDPVEEPEDPEEPEEDPEEESEGSEE